MKIITNAIVLVITITLLALTCRQTHAANILAFITDHSRSHCIIMDTLMKALVERNHNVSRLKLNLSFVAKKKLDSSGLEFYINELYCC